MSAGSASRSPVALVVHADWSVDGAKRWLALARRRADDRWCVHAPEPVGPLATLWRRLEARAQVGTILLGFDFPIGLPHSYAQLAGITDFRAALPMFGQGRWRTFYDVAATPQEISLEHPFYPRRAGGKGEARLQLLLDGLGLVERRDLLRRCDRATKDRAAAAALFWTLGAQQVGKAAISGWRDLVAPALRARRDLVIWPFEGELLALLERHRLVVAEAYPAEAGRQLGLPLARARGGGKRWQASRAACAYHLKRFARRHDLLLEEGLERELDTGFGAGAAGEDRFDAVVGLFGLLDVLFGGRRPDEPADPQVRRIEGWILGQETRAGAPDDAPTPNG